MDLPLPIKAFVVGFCLALLIVVSITLCGCKYAEGVTDQDGNPVATGPLCFNTDNGRFCYMPPDPPSPTEPDLLPLEK